MMINTRTEFARDADGGVAHRPFAAAALAGVNDRLLLSVAPGRRDRRALKVVDLARVKIDEPQPRTAATLCIGRSQRTDIRRVVLLPSASAGLGRVPGVATFRR